MKSINTNAPVSSAMSILINQKTDLVWEILTGINQWSMWQTDIPLAEMKETIKVGSTFSWKTGGVKIRSTLHTVRPFSEFGWTGKTMGIFAIHNWTLSAQNGMTKVLVEESMEGFPAILFKKSFQKNLEKGMLFWLESLKKECEQ